MSKDITLMGASYSAVPAVTLPQTGGGTATFTDVTDTTATAADVAQGKQFYSAAGILTTGTASGGGSQPLQMGVIRPDAELWKSYTYDQMAVADLGLTIPSYSTSAQTILSSSTIDSLTLEDTSHYNYCICERMLTIPEYSIETVGKGRDEYHLASYAYEYVVVPSGSLPSLINASKSTGASGINSGTPFYRLAYWSSTSTFTVYSTAAYGTFAVASAPTISNSSQLVIKSPQFNMRGSTSYFTSTYFNAVTDLRMQYVIEVWRAPKGTEAIDGWSNTSQAIHIAECLRNGGTLT